MTPEPVATRISAVSVDAVLFVIYGEQLLRLGRRLLALAGSRVLREWELTDWGVDSPKAKVIGTFPVLFSMVGGSRT